MHYSGNNQSESIKPKINKPKDSNPHHTIKQLKTQKREMEVKNELIRIALSLPHNTEKIKPLKILIKALLDINHNKQHKFTPSSELSFAELLKSIFSNKINALFALDLWVSTLRETTENLTAFIRNENIKNIKIYQILITILHIKATECEKTRDILAKAVKKQKYSASDIWRSINNAIHSAKSLDLPLSATIKRSLRKSSKKTKEESVNDLISHNYPNIKLSKLKEMQITAAMATMPNGPPSLQWIPVNKPSPSKVSPYYISKLNNNFITLIKSEITLAQKSESIKTTSTKQSSIRHKSNPKTENKTFTTKTFSKNQINALRAMDYWAATIENPQ